MGISGIFYAHGERNLYFGQPLGISSPHFAVSVRRPHCDKRCGALGATGFRILEINHVGGSPMSGVLLDDLSKHLDGYRELIAKRAEVEARLKRAEAEKPSVKEAIFKRVTSEYTAEINRLEKEMEPFREQVDKMRQDIVGKRDDVDAQIKEAEEEIEELKFRSRVGEFDTSQLEDRQKPLSERIEKLSHQAKELNELLDGIEVAEKPPEVETPAEASESDSKATADADGEDAQEPQPQSTSEASTKAAPEPTSKPTPEGNAKAAPEPPRKAGSKTSRKSEPQPESVSQSEPDASAKAEPPPEEGTVAESGDAGLENEAAANEGPRNEKGNLNGIIDTSNWAEELQRDMERTVHVRNRRATDKPKSETATSAPAHDAPSKAPEGGSRPTQKHVNEDGSPTAFPYLVITKGPGAGKKLPLIPVTMTLGREHDNNIELKDEDVSRYHARITFTNGDYRIEDLESSSGTWVNGERITDTVLTHGDKIKVGGTELLIDFE
jgi:hypothetical protein